MDRHWASPSRLTSLRMMSWMDLMEAERDMVRLFDNVIGNLVSTSHGAFLLLLFWGGILNRFVRPTLVQSRKGIPLTNSLPLFGDLD